MSENPDAAPTTEVTPKAPISDTRGSMTSPYGGQARTRVAVWLIDLGRGRFKQSQGGAGKSIDFSSSSTQ